MTFRKIVILMISLMLASPGWAAHLSRHTEVNTPQDVSEGLRDMQGNSQTLKNYTGKGNWLVVIIWASDCSVCNREIKEYIDFNTLNKDVDMLGISTDGWENIKEAMAFITQHKVTFPNLIGTFEAVNDIYENLTDMSLQGTPAFLVFAPDGVLKAQQFGAIPTQLIREFIDKQSSKSKK